MATEPAIGTRIKRARERKRWTQRHLAGLIGVSQKTVDNWENGRTEPKSSIGALEEVLGVHLGDEPAPGEPEISPEDLDALKADILKVLGDDLGGRLNREVDKAVADGPPSTGGESRKAEPRGRSGYREGGRQGGRASL